MDNWKVQILNSNPTFPSVVIDNWYLPEEEERIWSELNFYSSIPKDKTERAETTIVATNKDGKPLSQAFRFYPDTNYMPHFYKYVPTMDLVKKVRDDKFHDILRNIMPYYRGFSTSNHDSTIVSYYEDSDYYNPHHDTSLWTQLIWFVKEPRAFSGGDLILNETETKINLKHNRALFFPSCLLHEVIPIKKNKETDIKGWGKWTITHFYRNITRPKE